MTRTLISIFFVTTWLGVSPATAWDYKTSDPCSEPLKHAPQPDITYNPHEDGVAYTPEGIPVHPGYTSFSAAVDLNLPLASEFNIRPYNADLSDSEIDVGTALVSEDELYLNVLGHDGHTQNAQPVVMPPDPAASATTQNKPSILSTKDTSHCH